MYNLDFRGLRLDFSSLSYNESLFMRMYKVLYNNEPNEVNSRFIVYLQEGEMYFKLVFKQYLYDYLSTQINFRKIIS